MTEPKLQEQENKTFCSELHSKVYLCRFVVSGQIIKKYIYKNLLHLRAVVHGCVGEDGPSQEEWKEQPEIEWNTRSIGIDSNKRNDIKWIYTHTQKNNKNKWKRQTTTVVQSLKIAAHLNVWLLTILCAGMYHLSLSLCVYDMCVCVYLLCSCLCGFGSTNAWAQAFYVSAWFISKGYLSYPEFFMRSNGFEASWFAAHYTRTQCTQSTAIGKCKSVCSVLNWMDGSFP